MRKLPLLIVVLVIVAVFAFHSLDDSQIFEETSLLIYIGMDPTTGGKLEETTPIQFTFGLAGEKDGQGELSLLKATDPLLTKAIELSNSDTEHPIKDGKVQSVIINKELAQQGLLRLTDIHKLHAVNRFLPSYIICDGESGELLQALADKHVGDRSFTYLIDLLHNSGENALCPYDTRSGHMLNMLNDRIDPMFPLITATGGEIAIAGTALFREDIMVGRLDTEKSRYLHFMNQDYNSSVIAVPFVVPHSREHEVSFFVTKVRRDVEVAVSGDQVTAAFEVRIKGYVDQMNWSVITDKMNGEEFRNRVETQIRQQMEEVAATLQKLEADPLGVRELLRSRCPEFYATHDVRAAYKNADFQIEVRLELSNLSG